MESRPEELLYLGDVHHPGVVDEAGDDGVGGAAGVEGLRGGRRSDGLLLSVAADGAGGELPPARARVRATRSGPPNPRDVMSRTRERTTSAARRRGGF
jgi:hypothetical protein